MICLSNISINKTIIASATLPQKSDPSSPKQTNAPQPSLSATKTVTTPSSKNKLRNGPMRPSVVEIERAVGAGSFRDAEPREVDKKTSMIDWFLGQAVEGAVEKKLRTTGEWLANNPEKKVRSSGKSIVMFMFQWMLPIWAISLLVASGAIKLPFSSPFLDDLIM
ncbi:hypothetical protein RIF29_14939 [Crotalaria pallida]|uniref:Chlororespiratory reduction 3 n=1 Tax=Crotalaria pallida TaxID=3830 RepID=A0AAN9FE53_CROPI